MADENNALDLFNKPVQLPNVAETPVNFAELKFFTEHFIMRWAVDILQGRKRHSFEDALRAFNRLGAYFEYGGHRQHAHSVWLIAVAFQNGIEAASIPPKALEEGRLVLSKLKLDQRWQETLSKYAEG